MEKYKYRTPGLEIQRSFDKEVYCTSSTYYKKEDDASDTSETTRSCDDGVVVESVVVGDDDDDDDDDDCCHVIGQSDRRTSAMEAFLASPTGLNWDYLVRSLREEKFLQTVVTVKGPEDSSWSTVSDSVEGRGDQGSSSSVDSTLSSKSAFRKTSRKKKNSNTCHSTAQHHPIKDCHQHLHYDTYASGRRKKKNKRRDSLKKKVEKVLIQSDNMDMDTSQARLSQFSNIGEGERCAFSAVKKLPSIPDSFQDKETFRTAESASLADAKKRESWFHPLEQHPLSSNQEQTATIIRSPQPMRSSCLADIPLTNSSSLASSQLKLDITADTATTAPLNPIVQDNPPSFLHVSPSLESDEDNFYFHIRGRSSRSPISPTVAVVPGPRSKSNLDNSACSSCTFKAKDPKNPYAFTNHPLLPKVVEEGNISPFPTTFDELDCDNNDDTSNTAAGEATSQSHVNWENSCSNNREQRKEMKEAVGSYGASARSTTRIDHHDSKVSCHQVQGMPSSSQMMTHQNVRVVRTKASVTILPESLLPNKECRKGTCWQKATHRYRRSKGEF